MNVKQHLITGRDKNYLIHQLRQALTTATHIEIAVSFIRNSGLNLLFDDIEQALTSERRNVQLCLLTSDYMNITEPQALKRLMLLKERGADICVYESQQATSFHLKTYIFIREEHNALRSASAFIGSSNISKTALTDGIEWNYRIDHPDNLDAASMTKLSHVREEFQHLRSNPHVVALTYDWIAAYELRYEKARAQSLQPSAADLPDETEYHPPSPTDHQQEALTALVATREEGHHRGLVVLATGMGKTFLAAFDAAQCQARKVLFVAHREEILLQAESSFLAVMPNKKVGRYTGQQKDAEYDMLFGSVQTLGRQAHLATFAPDTFDYIVIDEFHHAAAGSYQQLLNHFEPSFLLGLTATPQRTDGSDILALCQHNLVYQKNLFEGVTANVLCPFSYFGIFDESVDYEHIPWRSGRFDPEKLSTKLATEARAKHTLKEWQDKAQSCTLAFCVSQKHADFMAAFFNSKGIAAASVHADSALSRSEALEQLALGDIKILFSVDLFNEGVDAPHIDTVLLLRPTESKILFLQQLGRGLRKHAEKSRLVVLDFVGNHHSFLNRPELLLASLTSGTPTRAKLIQMIEQADKLLPDGCYINFDLAFIDFLKSLANDVLPQQYQNLKATLGRRPTYTEFWQNGNSEATLRKHYGSWWQFVDEMGDLQPEELAVLETHLQWFKDLAITKTVKSYKLVLLDTLLAQNGVDTPVSLAELSDWAKHWYTTHPEWQADLPASKQPLQNVSANVWQTHWRSNPVHFWCTAERGSQRTWFSLNETQFSFTQPVDAEYRQTLVNMTREINEQRLRYYKQRNLPVADNTVVPFAKPVIDDATLPFFPDIKIACGHFKSGSAETSEQVLMPQGYGRLAAGKHFIARASGNSMNGGKAPIFDGDYLLFEQITSANAGSISNATIAIERQDTTGDNQYLLRKVLKQPDGNYLLRAANSDYEDLLASEEMVTFARLKGKVDPLELFVGKAFMREDIPELFGETFNPGNWHAGHIYLADHNAHVLLVTLDKAGKANALKFHDYFSGTTHFHWQSQNSTAPTNKRGQQIINHEKEGAKVYLFVREHKLLGNKAAPFVYYGNVIYESHTGEKPMNVTWRLVHEVSG